MVDRKGGWKGWFAHPHPNGEREHGVTTIPARVSWRGAWQSSNGCADWGVPLFTYRKSLWLKDTSTNNWRKRKLCRFWLTDKLLWLKIILKGIPWPPCWTHCESGRSFSQQYLQRERERGREKLLSFSSKSQDSSSLSLLFCCSL